MPVLVKHVNDFYNKAMMYKKPIYLKNILKIFVMKDEYVFSFIKIGYKPINIRIKLLAKILNRKEKKTNYIYIYIDLLNHRFLYGYLVSTSSQSLIYTNFIFFFEKKKQINKI